MFSPIRFWATVGCTELPNAKPGMTLAIIHHFKYILPKRIIMMAFKHGISAVKGLDSGAQLKFLCLRITHLITIMPASRLHFLANKDG